MFFLFSVIVVAAFKSCGIILALGGIQIFRSNYFFVMDIPHRTVYNTFMRCPKLLLT